MPTPYYTKIETDSIISNLPSGGGGNSTPETTTSLGQLINSSGNATITDSDLVATAVSSGVLRKASHAAVKMFYKLYYDTIYQPLLSSGINIKTLNGQSILGSGDVTITSSSGGATNLTTTQSPTTVIINSDTGLDASIALGNGTNAGVSINDYTTAEKSKLAGITSGATINSNDATLLSRDNHTGTQSASTISDFNSSVDGRITNKVDKVAGKSLVLDTEITKIATAVQPNINTVFTSVNSNAIVTLTYTANTLNWTGLESNLLKIVLTKDSILANPSTPINNTVYQFIIEQNSVGLWTLTYGDKFKFPNGTVPVIDLNANSKGLLSALYDGTHFLVVSVQNFL